MVGKAFCSSLNLYKMLLGGFKVKHQILLITEEMNIDANFEMLKLDYDTV